MGASIGGHGLYPVSYLPFKGMASPHPLGNLGSSHHRPGSLGPSLCLLLEGCFPAPILFCLGKEIPIYLLSLMTNVISSVKATLTLWWLKVPTVISMLLCSDRQDTHCLVYTGLTLCHQAGRLLRAEAMFLLCMSSIQHNEHPMADGL